MHDLNVYWRNISLYVKVLYMQIVHLSREVKVWFDSNSLARAIYALRKTFQVIIAHGRFFPTAPSQSLSHHNARIACNTLGND